MKSFDTKLCNEKLNLTYLVMCPAVENDLLLQFNSEKNIPDSNVIDTVSNNTKVVSSPCDNCIRRSVKKLSTVVAYLHHRSKECLTYLLIFSLNNEHSTI